MSFEKFKETDASNILIGKLLSIIARGHTIYLNHELEDLNINASQLQSLFEIKYSNGINQEKIASRCNIDKGAIARSVKKLEEKKLILKEVDKNNRRQNKISLTSKGDKTIEKSLEILYNWENEVFKDIPDEEKKYLHYILKEIAIKTISLNKDRNNKKIS